MNQTAVEFLAEKYNYITWMRNRDEISAATADEWRAKFLKEAKEMEKTSMCSFTTGYVNNCVEIDHNEIELTKEVEEYYDWLENTKCQCDEGFCETQDNCKGLYSKI